MSRKNVLITLAVILVAGAVVGANLYYRRDTGVAVTTETIRARDLEAIVSASGKIQPKRSVNISSDTVGRVVNLMVNEGDRVRAGQFLLQIDPRTLQARVDQETASLRANQGSLEQMQQSIETGKAQLERNLERERQLAAGAQGLSPQQIAARLLEG